GLADAAQVGHRLDAEPLLDPLRDLDRPLAGGPARAVGHGHVLGLVLLELAQCVLEVLLALVGLGREELEREHWSLLFEDLIDAHSRERLERRSAPRGDPGGLTPSEGSGTRSRAARCRAPCARASAR